MDYKSGKHETDGRRLRVLVLFLLTLGVAALAFVIWGIIATPSRDAAWQPGTRGVGIAPDAGREGGTIGIDPGEPVSLAYVIANDLEYYGDTLTVDGYAVKQVGGDAFAITAEAVPGNQSTLVIAGRKGQPTNLEPGRRVRVTGVLRRFDLRTIQREIGRRLDTEAYGAWNQEPCIVATRVVAQ